MPPPLVPTLDTGLIEVKRDSRKAGGRIQAQRHGTRGASRPEGSGFELELGGGRRPVGGSREPVPREEPPSPSWVHTALSLKPEPRSPHVPGPESAPGVAAPSRPPCPGPASCADASQVRPALGRDITVSSRVRPLPSGGCLTVSSSSVYLILPLFPVSIKLLLLLLPIILEIGGLASVTTGVCPSSDVLQIYLPLGFFPRPLVTMHF